MAVSIKKRPAPAGEFDLIHGCPGLRASVLKALKDKSDYEAFSYLNGMAKVRPNEGLAKELTQLATLVNSHGRSAAYKTLTNT